MRKLPGANQHIDEWQEFGKPSVDVVDVSSHNRPVTMSGARHNSTRRRIVRIQMQHATSGSQSCRRFIRTVSQSLIPVPDDCALTAASIDDDESDLVMSPFNHFGKFDVYTVSLE